MLRIDYRTYLDKVYGCWVGKCVAGTIGAPYEGAKELFNFEYSPKLIEEMLPNDDLDLQVLWLSVLEEKGIAFTSDDLADAFLNRCKYAPGEYAYFKKNYARGIHPPLSGAYNNRYYFEGMGCPIRSEIWACVAPGNPQLAADLAAKDGVLDHAGNSVCAEQFLAALESAAFFESDLDKLTEIALSVVPADSKFAGLVLDVRGWCGASGDWRYVRSQIIRKYGHPDCTNMYQNMGITLLSLYLGSDFLDTTMMALNCGFDTDCTCATAGSILGIIHGAEYLTKTFDFAEQRFVLGVDAPRRSDRVCDLAEDTCMMGLHFAEHLNREVAIVGTPQPSRIDLPTPEPVRITVDYGGVPAIGVGGTRTIKLLFENTTVGPIRGTASLSVPDGWHVTPVCADLTLDPGVNPWEVTVSVPSDIPVLNERNLFEAQFGEATYGFGIVGASVWEVFGPFWQNNVEMPPLKTGESYYAHIPGGCGKDEHADNVRTYHLNTRVDPDREYMTLDDLLSPKATGDAAKEGQAVCFYEDLMSISDAIGLQGPSAVYMVRRMISPEDRTLGVLVGHTDAYKLWINGELISRRDSVDWWTAENAHIHGVKINKGENTVVVEMIRRSADAKLSVLFVKSGSCSEHYYDFASVNPMRSAEAE